jgi:lipase
MLKFSTNRSESFFMPGSLHGFVNFKDLSFHYLVWNESNKKDTLLLVHDLEANAKMFTLWGNYLASQYQYRVISVDLRGRGESAKHGPFSLDLYIEDIGVLLKSLNIKKVVFIGSSFGATIGLKFTVKHPGKIAKLILVDGGAIPAVHTEKLNYLKSLKATIAHAGISYPSIEDYWKYWKNNSVFNSVWGDDVEDYLKANIDILPNGEVKNRIPEEAVAHDLLEMTTVRYEELYTRVKCPTLLVCSTQGMNDDSSPSLTTGTAQIITTSITNCKLYKVDGANHHAIIFSPQPGLMKEMDNFVQHG